MYAVGLEDWKVNARAVVKLRYTKNTIMLYIYFKHFVSENITTNYVNVSFF